MIYGECLGFLQRFTRNSCDIGPSAIAVKVDNQFVNCVWSCIFKRGHDVSQISLRGFQR